MPRIDIAELDYKTDQRAFARVWATMVYPDDEVKRENYFHILRLVGTIEDCPDDAPIVITVGDLKRLIHSKSFSQLEQETKGSTKKAIIAGTALATTYLMDRCNLPEPSLNKSTYVIQEWAKDTTYTDGAEMLVSNGTIATIWKKYRSVAHFWAAFQIAQSYPLDKSADPLSAEAFPKFLRLAAELFAFGCEFIPFRTNDSIKKPLLDSAESWYLPEFIARLRLKPDRLPDRLIEILATYKAPPSEI